MSDIRVIQWNNQEKEELSRSSHWKTSGPKKMPWLGSETLPLSLGGARDFNPYPVSQVIGQAQQHQAK
jgi:hypothetical protein